MHPTLRFLLLPVTLAIAVGGWVLILARFWCRRVWRWSWLAAVLLALTASAAKPEPLTYKLGGRRYVIAVPDRQLWSVSEVAQAASGHASGTLFIGGKEVRQARVRGDSGDRTNRNYLVVVMRTGKRLSPEARYMVRPDPFVRSALPLPPATAVRSKAAPAKSSPLQFLTLSWPDVPGWYALPWSPVPIMPDGGPRWWQVLRSADLRTWRVADIVATNRAVLPMLHPQEYFRVDFRGAGAPREVWP